ncbi:MAG: hypothetical protein ABSF23_01385 [Terracidiphilus sp.]|jgi:hypothetical protein
MANRRFIWGAALSAALSVTLVAQQAPPAAQQTQNDFYSVACVKVTLGKSADFGALVSGDMRKLAQAEVDSGRLSRWSASHTIVSAGSEAECDYRFISFYPGIPAEPISDEELAAALQKAGIGATPQQWRDRLNSVGSLVYSSIYQYQASVGGPKEGDYVVINEMSVPNTDDWIASEKKLWQPIFEDAVKDGAVDGWSVGVQLMPRGAKDPHRFYTADIYPNWASLFTLFGPGFLDRWKKVHPDVSIEDGMAQGQKVETIEHTTLYKIVAVAQAAK